MPTNPLTNRIQANFKTIETVLFFVVLAAVIMKTQHISFSGFVLVLSLSTLGMCYFLMANAALQEDENSRVALFANRILYLGCSIASMGILFSIQSWPSARMFLGLGSGLVLFAGIVCIKMQLKIRMVRWLTILAVAAFFLFTSKETLVKMNINRSEVPVQQP